METTDTPLQQPMNSLTALWEARPKEIHGCTHRFFISFHELEKIMFGKNIRRLRAAKGLTQGKLAELADIHKRYYQDLEACRKTPSVTVAARIQRALKCDWADLLRGV